MTRWAMMAVTVGALGLAGRAWAASPYNDANDGHWDTSDNADTWGQGVGVYPDTPGDAATIDSHEVRWIGVPAGVAITLDGGTIWEAGYYQVDQPITIGNSNPVGSLIVNTSTYKRMKLLNTAVLTGSGNLTLRAIGTGDGDLWIESSNPGFSGNMTVTGTSIRAAADQALGTGDITVYGAALSIAATQTVMPASLLVTNGGTLASKVDSVPDMTLANGTFMQTEQRLRNLPTSVVLQDATDNVIYGAGWDLFMEFKTGSISGGGNVTFKTDTDHNGIWLYNANTLSGTVAIAGKLFIKDPGGLGTVSDDLNITAGGLSTDLAAPANSVLQNIAAVNVSDAALSLKSTELNTTVITLNPGGGLRIAGGTTPLDYTPATGNVQVYHGAVLDEAFGTTHTAPDPAADEIQGAEPGTQPQVLMGVWRDPADTFIVGPGDGGGAGEILWSGISSMNRRMDVYGTVQEYTAGEGFTVNAMSLTQVTILNSAQLLGTGAAALTGSGKFEMRAGALAQGGSVPTVNMNASGELYLSNSDVVPAAATLNINGGWVRTSDTDSINAGATVNVNEGGVLVMRSNIVGQIHVNGGGGLYNVHTAALAAATMSWDAPEDNPAHLMLSGDCTSLPTDGHYHFVLNKDAQNFTSLVLGPDARLYGMYFKDQISRVNTGEISASAASDSARLTSRSDGSLWIYSKINLPGKKLVIGDTQPFHTLDCESRVPGGVYTWEDAPQAGVVVLRNPETGTTPANLNVIGAVEIQAGTLSLDAVSAVTSVNNLGNAAVVDIWEGATLYENDDNPTMSTVFMGKGTIQITNRPLNHRVYVQPKDLGGSVLAAGFAPGHSGGVLTLKGYLNFRNLDVGGTLYWPRMDVEVLNDGGSAAHGDHDQLVVTQDVENLDADLFVTMGVPNVGLVPASVNATFLTAGGNLSGAFNSVASGLLGADTGLDQTTRERVRDHWDIGADDIVYSPGAGGNVAVALDAADWTAIPGDADLDGSVLLSDLSILAFNWESDTGMTWLTADFDFNGIVDLADLSQLAFHWEDTESAGAPPVPEPMTVGILILGAVGVIRRRR